MTEVSSLTVRKAAPKEDVIKTLEDALAFARAGDLTDVMITGKLRGGDCYTSYATVASFELIGMLEQAKYSLLKSLPDVSRSE